MTISSSSFLKNNGMPAPDPGLRENYFIAGSSEEEGQGGVGEHNTPAK